MTDWCETRLFQELTQHEGPTAEAVRATLHQILPDIQRILSQGGTSPTDFTLHDAEHSFRVAERMTQIIPGDVLPKLSSYELALLLLAAYLHDIGMTPEQQKVNRHYTFLITGDAGGLGQEEVQEFQRWLDDSGYEIVPPLAKDAITSDALLLAREIITYYSRHRHNDWSAEWMTKELAKVALGSYGDWLNDLVTLCRSHHYGRDELTRSRFNARPVGSPGAVVHLRYLAAVLRVADILDFDPERTPEVILRHRDISPNSVIFWWKDKAISLVQEGARLVASARPGSARIHRAIEDTLNAVDDELRLCRQLADETDFKFCPGLHEDQPHRWDLPSSVHRDVAPKDGAYEYIDGAFRPDTRKLLELLSGLELYGSEMVAVRELLQNAFDAVREQIAYERLAQPNPGDPQLGQRLAAFHRVEVRLEKASDGVWLSCTDRGVGMTKTIIRDHLLVSGAARRHDILSLERRCQQEGFSVERTGQFGIGVLTYFMLADRVIIQTKRSQEAGDSDAIGWIFESDGIGSFGELLPDLKAPPGSKVRLHLRPAVVPDASVWYRKLAAYLAEALVHIPCGFQLDSVLPGCDAISCSVGWVQGADARTLQVLAQMEPHRWDRERQTPAELLSTSQRLERESKEGELAQAQDEGRRALHWLTREGTLPDGMGHFRLHLPYFELPGGASLGFLRVRDQGSERLLERIGDGYAFVPYARHQYAWKGMTVHADQSSYRHDLCYIEWNWTHPKAGRLSVNRSAMKLSAASIEVMTHAYSAASALLEYFLKQNETSQYATLNHRLARRPLSRKAPLNWITSGGPQGRSSWSSLTFPTVYLGKYHRGGAFWKAAPVLPSQLLRTGYVDAITWHSSHVEPHKVLLYGTYRLQLAPIWTSGPNPVEPGALLLPRFPAGWSSLSGASINAYDGERSGLLWNRANTVVRAASEDCRKWCQEAFQDAVDPLPRQTELLSSRGKSASWLLLIMRRAAWDLFEGLRDRDPDFLPQLWHLLRGSVNRKRANPKPVLFWEESTIELYLYVLTPNGVQRYGRKEDIVKYLPDPGPEWTVTTGIAEGTNRARREK